MHLLLFSLILKLLSHIKIGLPVLLTLIHYFFWQSTPYLSITLIELYRLTVHKTSLEKQQHSRIRNELCVQTLSALILASIIVMSMGSMIT